VYHPHDRVDPTPRFRPGDETMTSGIIFDIKKYAVHDGPGIRTTVFLKGCPLRCGWCHNPEGIAAAVDLIHRPDRCIGCQACVDGCIQKALSVRNQTLHRDPDRCTGCQDCVGRCPAEAMTRIGRTVAVSDVMAEIEKDIAFYDTSGGGVTFSGGEPLSQPRFLLDLLSAAGDAAIHRAVDTTGYAGPDLMRAIASQADLILYDLKHMDPEAHRRHTGVSNEPILANLIELCQRRHPVIVRIPVIPGINADEAHIRRLAVFISRLPGPPPVHMLPYHPAARAKYQRLGRTFTVFDRLGPQAPSTETLAALVASHGIDVTIGG